MFTFQVHGNVLLVIFAVAFPCFVSGNPFNADADGRKPSATSGNYVGVFADINIRGRVVSEEGPLAGVTVSVLGVGTTAISDPAGNYTITAPENGTLVFTYVGYTELRVPVRNQTTINVTLVSASSELEDVIVTGYRTQKRGTLTGSVSSVNSSEFADVPVDNLSNALSGRLSGVTITQAAGTPGMESAIRIRAQGTTNNASPLFVIDGVVSDKFAFD